jgi:tyrosine-protein kinase Etk/Wzc
MSKSKHHKNEATKGGEDPAAPIYQPPTMNDQPPTADSRQPTAESRFPHSRQPMAASCTTDEINLLDYLRVIYKYKWMITVITIIAMVATVALSLRRPRMYQASTSIVPPIDRLSQGGGLAGKLGGAGSMLLQGMLNEGDLSGLYVGILNSRAVADVLVDRFDLMNVYKKKAELTRTMARKILENNTSIKASKEGIVHVTVKDLDATRSSEIANAYIAELDMQNRRLSGGQATSKRVFLETRLKEIQGELSKIESLQSREVQIKEMLFELLNRECEIAKIEEAKSMPTIQVLDSAIVPERGMARGTAKKGILAGIATMMLGIFIAFGLEYVAGVQSAM